MSVVNLSKRNVGTGYQYTEVIATGTNGNTIIITSDISCNLTCRIIAGAGTGKFQFTLSSDASVLNGTCVWTDWPKGLVTGTDYDVLEGSITGLRGVSSSGEITIEIVR